MRTASLQHEDGADERGFTLVEIMVVVALIALVGGLGAGLYSGGQRKWQVEKAARQLLLTARYARIAAVEQQRAYDLQFDPEKKGFLVTTVERNEETQKSEKTTVRNTYCRPVEFTGQAQLEDLRIDASTRARAEDDEQAQAIRFLPNGSATSAVVQIGDGKHHYTVTVVAATGKASLHVGTADEMTTASIDLDAQER
jgi:type II secretion system protein H